MKSNAGIFTMLGSTDVYPGDGKNKIRLGVDSSTFP
jgi:hypothetical protein